MSFTRYEYKVISAKVVDGDTVDLTLDVGFHHTMTDRFRLYSPDPTSNVGLNAPEMDTPEGVAAKKYLEDLLHDILADASRTVIACTLKDKREKYGRWLVILLASYTNDNTTMFNFNREMIDSGHAARKVYAIGEGPLG